MLPIKKNSSATSACVCLHAGTPVFMCGDRGQLQEPSTWLRKGLTGQELAD